MANSYLAWARPRFARLQDGYLNGTYTRADLANLRNSFKKPCGSDPKASKWSLNGMDYRGYAKPTRMEQASWYAFGLYAYHQQGNQYKPLYKEGERFNKALRILADTGEDVDELYRKLLAQLEEGQDTVLAFITEGDGSIPRTTGAHMLVGREGRIFGTIGGGNLEYQAVLHAQELVQEKKSEYREYDLGTGEGKGLGMVCGGRVKVCFYFMNGAHGEAESLAQALAAQEQYRSYWIFFALGGTGIRVLEKEAWEMLPAAQEKAGHCRILELDGKTYYAEEFCYDGKVYLFGGGHLAQELVPVLHHLDFCCIVLDDREEYVDKALFPDAGQTMLVDFTKLDEILSIRKNDYLVIVTRGHRCDADAEAFALRTGASYIGVVGSRRKTKYVREKLEAQGFTGEQLDSVYAPIGIEIGSETPAEIAISIAAQLIQIRSAKTGKRKGAHPALHT